MACRHSREEDQVRTLSLLHHYTLAHCSNSDCTPVNVFHCIRTTHIHMEVCTRMEVPYNMFHTTHVEAFQCIFMKEWRFPNRSRQW